MILLAGIALGLLVGFWRAAKNQVPYEAPKLRYLWLVLVAFILQYIEQANRFPILASQLLFIGFVLLNSSFLGMKILLVGAALNFIVMLANGGFMPISFETAGRLTQVNLLDVPTGTLFGAKDILLPPEGTRFEWLADRFLPPAWLPYQFAFSLGDVFIAAGAFWLPANPSIQTRGQNS
jgi:hypothetical protein